MNINSLFIALLCLCGNSFSALNGKALHPEAYDKVPYYGQYRQDKFFNEQFFKNKKNGVYVDIGAYDGISFSNTYFFDKELGWKGICIEPNPDVFKELFENRPNAICLPLCISNYNGQAYFLKVHPPHEMLSGIVNEFDPRQLARIDHDMQGISQHTTVMPVEVRKISDILIEHGLYEIDLLTIDVEGAEKTILSDIDFKKFNIRYIVVENNFHESGIAEYLLQQGYRIVKRSDDDFFERIS